ncbi:diguanylate cyclase [Rhodobacter veldkampii DSM 11550]|uniref:dihydroneopterin aldolase n=1 Tax=Phaeovulum veldkampii DSM 11550 TaxID=1185920 RepID=A0A2T4JHM1_9RHOB|nr:dihydroneopterin aldolase [Phaeovulum veldkampii]MBK5945575.1 diguanylate cyclase [Phaeovulum veldkampii DSM 11550]PTE17318.1 diguanylate cyclase [Phaeovulum veldkampii DSM 11550]TDQ56337.1 dihydroneopterin aldolase [Phaeovulum veldkampii DSM 11550]
MTSDITLAFAHPEERAEASAGADPRDRISLRDHVVTADIGAFQPERGHVQRLRFNVVVEVRPAPAPLLDDVDRILSYDRLTEAIAAELADERLNLLETLAERVAERILAEPQAMRVFVRIEKLDRGPGALGVEIVRSRAAVPVQAATGGAVLHPLVAFLTNAAIASPDLPARLDRLQAAGLPVILAVGLPDLPRPETGHRPTQRRIDLLAIEQNAWVLAARDPRCVVVATRTEIDWAMKQGRMIVWAPSKIVLDAVDGPKAPARDAVALALWLAESLAAARLELHGSVSAPAGSRVPVVPVTA